MTWVKICGTTNLEDALMAVDAGADALGFVFYEKSPRKIDPQIARQIVAKLPPNVEKVGVFVEEEPEHVAEIARCAGLTALQLHAIGFAKGRVGEGWCFGVGKIYLAFPAGLFLDQGVQWFGAEQRPSVISGIFLDSGTPHQPGGTGRAFDWAKAAPLVATMKESVKVVIAGGLTSTNVAEAIRTLHPWGVDVASGVEAKPGKKDPEKVRAFVAAVRTAEMTR
jgi:phosphoribosylanthranilate isomerase